MMEWILSSSVLILVVLLIRRLTLGRISMRLRYALWALVLVRLLVPFSFGSTPVSIMNTAQQVPVIQDAQVLHDIGHIEHTQGGAVEGYHQSDYMADFPTVIAEQKSEEEFSRMTTVLNLRDVLIPLWKTGVLFLFAAFLLANLRFRRALRKNRRQLEVSDFPLPVYATDSVETPCLFGLIRPTVYVTPEVANDPQALHYALEHELTHFYQGDFVWAILRCVCLCLHWFNPLVWLAVRLSRQDAELSCDEGTIRRLGESHRVAYGNTLIDLTCTQRRPVEVLYAATTMTGSKKSIRERVTFIARKPRNLALAVVIVALVTAVAVGCTFTGANQPKEEPDDAPVPLTEVELAFFQENYFSGTSITTQFLTSLYTSPENIDLRQLFYNGTSLPGAMSDREYQLLAQRYPGISSEIDCAKLPVQDMDAILKQYTGLHFADTQKLGMDGMMYLEEYDAYYEFHSDTNAMSVELTGGFRQGNQVSLYYEDKMVTLVEAGGGCHFLSNQFAPMPTLSVQLPDAEPFLTVPISSLPASDPKQISSTPFTRQEWGQLVNSFFYQGTDGQPDRSILSGVWPDGAIYACYVVYDNASGEDTYYRFAKLCDAAYTEELLNSEPGTLLIRPYADFLGYSGFSLFCSYSEPVQRYYTFNSDGRLMQLLESSGTIDRQFTAGSRTFAFDDAGGLENARLLIRDGDGLRAASLGKLLGQELPDSAEHTLTQVNDRGVGVITYYDGTNAYLPLCDVRVACDGKNLCFYPGEEQTYTDGIADHIVVPDAVLEQARWIAEQDLTYLLARYPDMDTLDDWHISDIVLQEAKTVDGVPVELYAPRINFHTADPEHFPYAGGTTVTTDGWLNMDSGYFQSYDMILHNVQTGECLVAPGDPYTDNTIDTLLADFPQLRAALTYVAELWGVQEGDGVELILRQSPGHEPRQIRWRVGHWDIPGAETYFRHLSEINWVPAEPVETAERASVTLVTQRYNLTAYEGTTAVTRTKPDNPEEWLKPDSDDYFDKPYEWILRSWFDELELAYLNAQEIVIPDQGQTWQEAAQAFADAYYGCYAKTSSGSQNHWTYVSTEIEPLEAETEAAIKADGYLSQDSFPFFLRAVFVPENQRAAKSAMAGNTGDYTGDDPRVPADALEFSRCVTVEKRDDGWHGEIRGTGW